LLSLIGLIIVVYGSFIEPRILTVTDVDIDLPIKTHLKIAVISDFEIGPYTPPSLIPRIVRRVNNLLPDIVLLPGDFIYTDSFDINTLAPLAKLNPALGTFAVLGNHESGRYRNAFSFQPIRRNDYREEITLYLESLGIHVIRNAKRIIELPDESLYIAGIEDLWSNEDRLDHALSGIPKESPTILLSHNPSIIEDSRINDIDLIVSGHTHGGQIRLPVFGSLAPLPTTIGREFDQGLFSISTKTTLAITRGIGETNTRVRLFAPPEILLLRTY
jgi:uncharacterized protein